MTNQILALPYECWGWFPGYVGLYQVSTRGQVRGVDRWVIYKDGSKHFYKGRILKPKRDKKTGYLYVTLSRNNKQRKFYIHRMVAEVWLDNPEGKPEVNHRNEQKDMNFVENLSYCTRKENMAWGTGIERRSASRLKPVQALDVKTGQVVREFPSIKEAGRNGFHQSHISACCLGKYGYRTHKGYIWRFKP